MSRRSAAGDKAAFAMLVEKYERPLRSFLARMDANEADDVAQEAFLRAWRFAGSYDGRARYSTWLTSIAWRCRVDAVRRSRASLPRTGPVEAAAPARSDIADMLERLSEPERAALILCEGQGWTHGEAAELLGLPLGTVKSQVARAKAKCREMWSAADHG